MKSVGQNMTHIHRFVLSKNHPCKFLKATPDRRDKNTTYVSMNIFKSLKILEYINKRSILSLVTLNKPKNYNELSIDIAGFSFI